MGLHLGLGLTGQRVGFNPASLFTVAGSRGFAFDLSDYGTQWQDTAGTVPITSTSQSVARVNDKSGLGNHATQGTAGSRAATVVFPASGVRNRANGSASVGDATFWPASRVSAGVTITRVSSGFDTDGLPYADVRVQGTTTSTFSDIAYENGLSRTAATVGQSFTGSAFVRLVGGTTANITGIAVLAVEETAPFTYVAQGGNSQIVGTTEVLMTGTRTIASGNQARTAVVLSFTNGAVIDATYRIKALQFELGSTRTAYQFNYSAQNVTEPGFASIRGIQFDGVDDWLQTAAIDFSNSDEVTVVAGVRKLSDALFGVVAELSNTYAAGSGVFTLNAPNVPATATYGWGSKGSIERYVSSPSSFAAPISAVVTGIGNISGDASTLRVNGTQVATSASDQGTGNFSNAPVFIGRRGGTANAFNGVLTFLFAINRLLTANELAMVEAYANARTGAF